ncbi:MAG: DNA-binding response regulator, partial [Solirubrobacterales bacterium]|nr:DNA-binding response regulator [Solirubrobacterales bacterium]
DVLAAMAEGKSNRGIAESLVVTQAAVEKHVTGIFQKLELTPGRPSIAVSSRSSPTSASRVARARQRQSEHDPGAVAGRALDRERPRQGIDAIA